MIALLRLSRPHFLLGGVLLFALGATAAGGLTAAGYLLGQAMVSTIQVTAHLVNEYADAEADAAVLHRTWFSGGSGVLAAGAVERSTALRMAFGTTVAALVAIAVVAVRSPVAGAIGALALTVAWTYSIEPIRLLGTGWGELATTVVVAAGVPLAGAFADGGPATPALGWAIGALAPIHLGMMLIFELPDLDSDRSTGKRVLSVRLGGRRARSLADACFIGAFAVVAIALAVGGLEDAAAWSFAATVPAVTTVLAARRARWTSATASAVATLVVTALGLTPGL